MSHLGRAPLDELPQERVDELVLLDGLDAAIAMHPQVVHQLEYREIGEIAGSDDAHRVDDGQDGACPADASAAVDNYSLAFRDGLNHGIAYFLDNIVGRLGRNPEVLPTEPLS